jgi:hypothetical protein
MVQVSGVPRGNATLPKLEYPNSKLPNGEKTFYRIFQ